MKLYMNYIGKRIEHYILGIVLWIFIKVYTVLAFINTVIKVIKGKVEIKDFAAAYGENVWWTQDRWNEWKNE